MTNLDTIPISKRSFDQAMQTLVCFTEGTLSQIDPEVLAYAIAQDPELNTWFGQQLLAAQAILNSLSDATTRSAPVATRR